MKVFLDFDNCGFDNFFELKESAKSEVKLCLEMPVIISQQSQNEVVRSLVSAIQIELSKIKWIIVGSVVVDFLWYLNDVERQETDKVGDIDNISKPIQDALTGHLGVLVDDSQIGGLYTYWQTRENPNHDNVLYITIKFNNDYALLKDKLFFIQYTGAICLPYNIDLSSKNELIFLKLLIKQRLKARKLANKMRNLACNADRYLVRNEFEFHRTRVNGFPRSQILSITQLNFHCTQQGISMVDLRALFKSK